MVIHIYSNKANFTKFSKINNFLVNYSMKRILTIYPFNYQIIKNFIKTKLIQIRNARFTENFVSR